jgi:imidazolonepropionase-like amidohydrolase
MDLAHCTLLPGLVDSHVHLFMSGTLDPDIRQKQLDASFDEMRGVIPGHLKAQLSHGVVALRDGGDYAGHALRFKEGCLPSSGLPIALRSPGKAWHAPGRYGRLIGRPAPDGDLAGAITGEKARVDHVKIVNSGLNSLTEFGKETRPQFTVEQLRAGVRAARGLGRKTMVHANGKTPVRRAVMAGCDSIEHGFFMGKENLMRMADRGTTWVPTAFTMGAYHDCLGSGTPEGEVARRNLESQLEQMVLAASSGVRVALGTDCGSPGVHHGRAVIEELRMLMSAGYSVEKAIQCATLNGAALIGLDREMGRLVPGMPATLVATRGGPACLPDSLADPEAIAIQGRWVKVPHQG